MKNRLVVLTLMLSALSFNVFANCDNEVKYISDEGVKSAALVACLKAEKAKESTSDVVKDALTNPDKLSNLAKSYSSAVGIMARDLGMAANEFIKTDAGLIAVLAILWTLFGSTIQGVFGTFIIIPILLLSWRLTLDTFNPKLIEIDAKDKKGNALMRRKSWEEMEEGQCVWLVVFTIAILLSIILVSIFGLLP
ncbi:hypothetical protein Va1_323 [Vibrio phage Va1]|nr:hypothetical protein Va1_323 [Vibrio phage Va1]